MSGVLEIMGQIEGRKREVAPATKVESRLDLSRRIPELDGLRGAAIGMVVIVHYVWFALLDHPSILLGHLFSLSRPLWSAVDLFFVLSGFLIGGNLLDARDSPNYFSTFYIRRFCRVLPIYFLFIGLLWLGYRFVYRPVGAPLDVLFAARLPWYSYLSFAQNLWMAKLNSIGPPILAITWAFAVEVQFYLLVPAIIRLVRRSALPYIFITGIAIAPVVRLFIMYKFPANLWATYVLLPCRMDSLFFGLFCAYRLREPGVWDWLIKKRKVLWMALLAMLAGVLILNTGAGPFAFWWETVGYGWVSMFYSTVLILAITNSQSLLSRTLRSRVLTGLGTISYGLYLFHASIYGFCIWLLARHGYHVRGWMDFGVTTLILAATLAFGKLSWQYFERPIVRWSHKRLYCKPTVETGAKDLPHEWWTSVSTPGDAFLTREMRPLAMFPAYRSSGKVEIT
jgi:peptidoglycan/LPS O-acetylase OafA/YrhL